VRLIAAGTMFGMWGWLASMAVLQETGSDALAGLSFGLVVALIVWAFDKRRGLDD